MRLTMTWTIYSQYMDTGIYFAESIDIALIIKQSSQQRADTCIKYNLKDGDQRLSFFR